MTELNKNKNVSAQENAEIAIAQLRNDYAAKAREEYAAEAHRLKEERNNALRENWILQQQAEAALPEKLAAQGVNGGAGETSLAALRAQYQGGRNDIESGYLDNLGELSQEHISETAEAEKGYNEKWLEYLLSLAKAENDRKYK